MQVQYRNLILVKRGCQTVNFYNKLWSESLWINFVNIIYISIWSLQNDTFMFYFEQFLPVLKVFKVWLFPDTIMFEKTSLA